MSEQMHDDTKKIFFLATIAFSSGAIVMALEIAGSRVITPVFGSSITTWGILIGIILTGLATGYFLGGRISDLNPSFEKLCSIVFSTGLFILFIPFISQSLIEFFIESMPTSSTATFFSALTIFGLPAVLLGFVSPYAIKLAAKTLHKIGTTTGNLYSISTLGSIFGTFLTIFALIPFFEIQNLILAFGFCLMAISVIGLGKIPKIITVVLIIVFVATSGTLNVTDSFGLDSDILMKQETPYSSLIVTEKDGFRTMYIDGSVHSSMSLEDPNKLVLYYTKSFHLANLINPEIEDVLFVGGGGLSGPKSFFYNYDKIKIDVSEIDPVVIMASENYFFVPDNERLSIINEDSRVHLTKTQNQYDAIILDAYKGYSIPFHLMTEEFYLLIDEKLSDDGIVVSNFVGSLEGDNSNLFHSTHKTMKEVFPKVYVFPANVNNLEYRQNITLLGLKGESISKFEKILKNDLDCNVPELECEKFFNNHYTASVDNNAPILTDRFSPVNTMDKVGDESFIYNEIKKDRIDLQGLMASDLLIQVGLILAIVCWLYPLQNTWRKNTGENF